MIRLFLFIALLVLEGFGDARSDGVALGQASLGQYGNSGSLVSNLGTPLVSKTKMKTASGTQFDAQVLCTDSSKTSFMSMTLTGSGEITLSASMDKDLSGSKESSWTFSGISGVCANGVISCSSNSWSNCTFKKWDYSAANLTLIPVNNYELGGCFCTNGSCGNLITTQHDYILDILGSGISSVVSGSSPNYVISNRVINSGTLEIWAQDSACVNPNGTTPPTFNERDDSQILSQTQTLQTQQMASGSGEYGLLTTSIASQNSESTTKSCTIRNEAGFNSTGELSNSHTDSCSAYYADATCKLKDEVIYDKTNYSVSTISNYVATGVHPLATCTSLSNNGVQYTVCADGSSINYYAAGGTTVPLYSDPIAWWKIERHYVCNAPQNNDFTAMKQRTATAKNSSTWNGTSVSFDNQYKDANGNWVTKNESADIYTFGSEKAKYCEVEFIAQSNDVFSDTTNRSNQNNNTTVKKMEVRECTDNWTVCPLNAGETVKHTCGNINDFSEAVSALNAVNDATKDMVCSLK